MPAELPPEMLLTMMPELPHMPLLPNLPFGDDHHLTVEEYTSYLRNYEGIDLDSLGIEDIQHLLFAKTLQMSIVAEETRVLNQILDERCLDDTEQFRAVVAQNPVFDVLTEGAAYSLYEFGLRSKEDLEKATEKEILKLPDVGKGSVAKLKKAGVHFSEVSQLTPNTWDIRATFYDDGRMEYRGAIPDPDRPPVTKRSTRVIRMPMTMSFFDLAAEIVDSFDLINDHGHAFFMDNHVWSDNAYYPQFIIDESPSHYPGPATEDVYLDTLTEGQKFAMVFDFGDEWRFRCQVKNPQYSGPHPEPEVVYTFGNPPEQYPEYAD